MFGTRLLAATTVSLTLAGSLAPSALAQPDTTAAADQADAGTIRSQLLPEVVRTRQVSPGIVQVTGDGTRRRLDDVATIFIGQDGSVWLSRNDRNIFRLGVPGASPPLAHMLRWYGLSVAANGNLRAQHRLDGLQELRNGRWVKLDPDIDKPYPVHPEANEWTTPFQSSDGSWWYGVADPGGAEVLRRSPDGAWERLGLPGAQGTARQFLEAPGGTLWAIGSMGGPSAALFSFDGEQWEPVEVFDDGTGFSAQGLRLDDDGALVVSGYAFNADGSDHVEIRPADSGWTVEPIHDPWEEFPLLYKADLGPLGEDGTGWAIGEDGSYLAWFDGETATRIDVPSRRRSVRPRIKDYQVAPDGSIWVIVQDARRDQDRAAGDGLYVITSKAAAVRE